MENTGYIKLHRAMTENALYKKPNYLAVWIDILLNVNHKPKERIFKGQKIVVGEGEGIFFQKEIADKFGISTGSVSYILKYLKVENQIEIETTNSFSIIKVKNWNKYQGVESDFENQVNAKGTPSETPKEGKNDNKDIYAQEFENFYSLYPKKIDKKDSKLKFALKAKKDGIEKIMQGLTNWKNKWDTEGTGIQFIPSPLVWLNKEKYNDEFGDVKNTEETKSKYTSEERERLLGLI